MVTKLRACPIGLSSLITTLGTTLILRLFGRAMSSPEEEAYQIARYLDANYVLVIFGGMSNYSGDDISKFLWMVRIAAGVFPKIKENNYYNRGHYRVDKEASPTMKKSLMYRLCYYRFGEVRTRGDQPSG